MRSQVLCTSSSTKPTKCAASSEPLAALSSRAVRPWPSLLPAGSLEDGARKYIPASTAPPTSSPGRPKREASQNKMPTPPMPAAEVPPAPRSSITSLLR
jgi:hypothetical protein